MIFGWGGGGGGDFGHKNNVGQREGEDFDYKNDDGGGGGGERGLRP